MIHKKRLFFFLLFLFLNACSFDSKTGIWSGSEDEKRKISDLEKKQKQIINIEKIYSSDSLFSEEKNLAESVVLPKPKKNKSWNMDGLNHQNDLGNIYLPKVQNIFLKKKIGKDKFSTAQSTTSLLMYDENIIFSDDTGTIFNIFSNGKVRWKKNIYLKTYKKIYKILSLSIYENNIYVADNIGFIYSINLNSGKLIWIKNLGVPIKSNIKIFKGQIFLIDQDNRIISLNTKDGSKIWGILTLSSFIKSQNLLSLAISEDEDLISINSAADLFRVQGLNGDVYWNRNTTDTLYAHATDFFKSSDVLIKNNEIIFSSGRTMYSYNIETGNINWENKVSTIGVPIISGENIFLNTENGYFVILSKSNGKIISSANILKILKKRKRETKITGFILGSGKIYSVTFNGYLIVSSATSGKAEYFKKIGDRITVSPIINNGKLYILTDNSKIIGFN